MSELNYLIAKLLKTISHLSPFFFSNSVELEPQYGYGPRLPVARLRPRLRRSSFLIADPVIMF